VGVEPAALQQVAGEQVVGPGVEALLAQLIGGLDVAAQLGVGDAPGLARPALLVRGGIRIFAYIVELALLKLEGYTNEEVAGRLACSVRTVKRRLALIRRTWEDAEG
jgi:hypothetical protein